MLSRLVFASALDGEVDGKRAALASPFVPVTGSLVVFELLLRVSGDETREVEWLANGLICLLPR